MAVSKADLPPELLDRIFRYCERFRTDFSKTTLVPNSRLRLLLLVCKKWHGIAERILYSSVSIGSDVAVKDKNGEKRVILGKDVCRRFCETVEKNARIASLVRTLRLGCEHIQPEESKMHVRVIRACTKVESLEVFGCDASVLDDLKVALAKADLISLDLKGVGIRDYSRIASSSTGSMFYSSEIVALLPNWPRLQTISALFGYARDVDRLAHVEQPSDWKELEDVCPALRRISFDNVIDTRDLAFLAQKAPNLEDIHLLVEKDCSAVLQRCLEKWSSSLKRLSFNAYAFFYSGSVPPDFTPALTPSMAKLHELRSLDVTAPFFTASALVLLPKLEKLRFRRGTYSQCMELAKLIGKGELPCLRELESSSFEFNGSLPPDEEREACDRLEHEVGSELRRVCRERNIFYMDIFTSEEELMEHDGYGEEIYSEESDNDWS